jgi:DNA processing protein
VLAEGILHFKLKRELRDVWDDGRAVVVSEFLPGLPWSVHHAMQRNRTICGLSLAMVLIEARENGGSYEAGKASLELGVPLFAAVYEGMPVSATGNSELLGKGAKPLMRSRSTHRANLSPVLTAVAGEKERLLGRASEPRATQLSVFR